MASNFTPIGSEIQVNQITDRAQSTPDVALLTDGRFLVAYAHNFSPTDFDIHLQLVNPDGTLSGTTIEVERDGGAQFDPVVASRLGGGAVVFWEDVASSDTVHLQVVNNDGSLSGNELEVADAAARLINPDAVMLANGQVVVTFQAELDPGTDQNIHLRVLNADGTTFGNLVTVDDSLDSEHVNAAIAASSNNALIVYQDTTSGFDDIVARLYDGNSETVGAKVTVGTTGDLTDPDVAALTDGRFVAVWDDEDIGDIQGRFLDANGNPLGAVFTISEAGGNNDTSRVAALPDGGFLATWDNNGGLFATEPGGSRAVVAQRFDATGAPAGDLFLVNAGDPESGQEDPAIASNPLNGQTFIAWEDFAVQLEDAVPSGIRGHAFAPVTDIVNGTAGADLIRTFSLGEQINGLDGDDLIFSFGGNDLVHGNSGVDGIFGGLGNDLLFGDAGADKLNGEDGNDLLDGGKGKDRLDGGLGQDKFDFNTLGDGGKGANRDFISAFSHAEHDRIDLKTIDANVTFGGNQAFRFIGAGGFHEVAGELRFSGGILQADVNGNGVADFEIKVTGAASLVNADFVL